MWGFINRKGGPVWKSQNRALVGTSSSTGAIRPPHPAPLPYLVGVVYSVRGCVEVHKHQSANTMDNKSPTWQDAVECGCEEEWLDAYNSQNDG